MYVGTQMSILIYSSPYNSYAQNKPSIIIVEDNARNELRKVVLEEPFWD